MTEKLDWQWDNNSQEQIAKISDDWRIRAVQDESPQNPFEEWDGNWPIVVRSPDAFSGFTDYNKTGGVDLLLPLSRFNDAQLIHWQVHIAKDVFSNTVGGLLACHDLDRVDVRYSRDAEELRHAFETEWDSFIEDQEKFDACVKLYTMLDIATYNTTSRGYSQGDWADILVVATPEARKAFGREGDEFNPDTELPCAAELYGDWAWGNVYGYIVERCTERDEDGEPLEWEEVEDGSCWGYYGTDHSENGLEDAAIECLPDGVYMKELVHA